MTPQQRTALGSIAAASALVAVKLVVGLLAHSLALVADAAHSGSDVVAALLTFFALGVAARPADRGHPYGHGKAEHLSALGEGAVLVLVSLGVIIASIRQLGSPGHVNAQWYVLAVVVLVILVDAARWLTSRRAARRHSSPALEGNALHFSLDMAGSIAVLVGLVAVRAGYVHGDAIAAIVVALLVLLSAGRLMRANIRVLMDSAPSESAEEAARTAIASLPENLTLRRLRMRESSGIHFADVVVGVEPDAALAHGHAVASAIEEAIERELPGSDVVVHVEPDPELAPMRQRATAAALEVAAVREVHNVSILRVGESTELSLHMKVPGSLTLAEAHELASRVEAGIERSLAGVARVETHIEPLAEDTATPARSTLGMDEEREAVARIVRELTGREPLELRFRETPDGLLAFLSLGLDPRASLVDAHAQASKVEERIREERPEIFDVLVHTEPAG